MPKPTLIQRAFGIPTQTYADNSGSSLHSGSDAGLPLSSPFNGRLRTPSIRSTTSSRAMSDAGRSRLSVTFDDGASDGGRSYASSIRSNNTFASRTSAFKLSPMAQRRLSSQSSSASDIGPSLRGGQQSGLLLSGSSLKLPKPGARTSRRYSSAENLAALKVKEERRAELKLPPPLLSKAEEAYAASQKRMAHLAAIGDQPPAADNAHNLDASSRLRVSGSSDGLKSSTSSNDHLRPDMVHRSPSSSSTRSSSRKKKTPEEIVAALDKAGLLDRVMEVVHEEDEERTPSPQPERPTWLTRGASESTIKAFAAPHEPSVTADSVPRTSVDSHQSHDSRSPNSTSSAAAANGIVAADSTLHNGRSLKHQAATPHSVAKSSAPGHADPAHSKSARTGVASADHMTVPGKSPPMQSSPKAKSVAHPLIKNGSHKGAASLAAKTKPEAAKVKDADATRESQLQVSPATLTKIPSHTSLSSLNSISTLAAYPMVRVDKAPPEPLLFGERPPASHNLPLVLSKFAFERAPTAVILQGQIRGLSPPLRVLVRHTLNGWRSQSDIEAESNAAGDWSCEISVGREAGRMDMAMRLSDAHGREVWDSNDGRDYCANFAATESNGQTAASPPSAQKPSHPSSSSPLPSGTTGLPKPVFGSSAGWSAALPAPATVKGSASSTPPLSESEQSDLSGASSATVPTTLGSDIVTDLPLLKPVPLRAETGTMKPEAGTAELVQDLPRMTLTGPDAADARTQALSMPETPPIQHRVTFAELPEEVPARPSPPLPIKSIRRPPAAASASSPSWAPNAKSLTGPEGSGGLSKPKKPPVKATTATSRTLSESLPKAKTTAQFLSEDPAILLAESLPKAPPRATAPKEEPIVPPLARTASPVPEATTTQGHSPIAPLTKANGEALRAVSPESPAKPDGIIPQSVSRSHSISGGSFANEPFVSKRSRLAAIDAASDTGIARTRMDSISPPQSDDHAGLASASASPAFELQTSRRYAFDGPPLRSSASAMDMPRGAARLSRSMFSDVSASGRSDHARSLMSVPTGAYRPFRKPEKVGYLSEKIDTASPTMCAIAIMSNAATSLSQSRFSLFSSKSRSDSDAPAHLSGSSTKRGPTAMFTDAASAPKKLGSGDVLVQIYAVGIDMWDRARVDTLVNRGDGYGYIPGRSFCGKALECGIDVTRIRKGDFVYGLQDLRKSGALADLCVVNRDYIALAPQAALSIEQIAILPCSGVSTFQAMETICHDLPRGSKILILNAHVGVGAIALQLSQALQRGHDLWVTCQCPTRAVEAETICRANGASETLCDDPLVVLNSLHESSYDAVVDTVGGRRIYDASRRVLHHNGLFVTLVGDDVAPPTSKTQWKSGIRSLRRAFVKKDKKAIGYLCPSLDDREDCRETLDRLTSLAEASLLHPVVKCVLTFEHGGEAFAPGEEEGTCVRILET